MYFDHIKWVHQLPQILMNLDNSSAGSLCNDWGSKPNGFVVIIPANIVIWGHTQFSDTPM